MSDLFAIIAFLANLMFFNWFGATLKSINRQFLGMSPITPSDKLNCWHRLRM